MTRDEYIKSRTEYWMEPHKGVKMPKRLAIGCAEEDYERYVEKYGEESLKDR